MFLFLIMILYIYRKYCVLIANFKCKCLKHKYEIMKFGSLIFIPDTKKVIIIVII